MSKVANSWHSERLDRDVQEPPTDDAADHRPQANVAQQPALEVLPRPRSHEPRTPQREPNREHQEVGRAQTQVDCFLAKAQSSSSDFLMVSGQRGWPCWKLNRPVRAQKRRKHGLSPSELLEVAFMSRPFTK